VYEKYCAHLVVAINTLLEATRKSSQLMSAIEVAKFCSISNVLEIERQRGFNGNGYTYIA
jgi:hypothetical protein